MPVLSTAKKSVFLKVAITVWLTLPGTGDGRGENRPETFGHQEIDALAAKEIESGGAVGLSIGVARGDEVLHLKGYGLIDLENSVPASEKSVYRIGSITKMFTAAAILQLVEKGDLSLDDPLTKFFPDYPSPGERVTVRHLLNHTSGIVSFTSLPDHRAGMRRDLEHDEVVARFRDLPFRFSPGEKFEYCNSGYYLLGVIIETVSGQKYEDFLTEHILEPLGLNATVYDRHGRIIPNRARGYAIWGERRFNAPFVSMTQPFAAGALASTAGDLIRWQRALVGGEVLKAETFGQMTAPGRLANGKETRYGFGCFLESFEGGTVVRHGGGIPGFVSELAWFREMDLTVVVLSNSNRGRPREVARKIAGLFSEKSPAPSGGE